MTKGTNETPHHSPARSPWGDNWEWLGISTLGSVALTLGCVGFFKWFAETDDSATRFDVVYRALRLFLMDAGDASGKLPWELQVARFLAPAAPVWAVLKALAAVFRERIETFRLRRMTGHAVICGLGQKGSQLARDFLAAGSRVVAIEEDEGNDEARACRELGAHILWGNAADSLVLREAGAGRAACVIATCGDDAINAEIALLTYGLAEEKHAAVSRPTLCLIHVANQTLLALLRDHPVFSAASHLVETRVFNAFQDAARLGLAMHPPDRGLITAGDPRQVHLVLIGFGQMGEAVGLQAARIGHYANGKPLHITVIDRAAEARKKRFLARYPQFERICQIDFVTGDADETRILDSLLEWVSDADSVTTVMVCFDGDRRGLFCALSIHAHLKGRPAPICVRMAEDMTLTALWDHDSDAANQRPPVSAFGKTLEICTRTALLDPKIDYLAQAIHRRYVEKRKADGVTESDPSMRPWAKLNPDLRDSNRQQADHISVKLRAIGCHGAEPGRAGNAVKSFTDDEVETLARMEHARWNAERFLGGWTPGPRDAEKKTSPYLVEWDDLPENIKEYDRQAVREIPRLLEFVGQRVFRNSPSTVAETEARQIRA